ncbi:DNA primase [Lactobacillus sp. DCY120]|uniref:DNA primase n=1 Tax=Bombilactobacillus apium TaxID=2675299 RepID=A0A850R8V9_9LACO|nr:DNA primase [Bombilactobacillus apium]NVY95836.1 DNA primase [Bombilactobacillus apium]
MVTKIPEDFIEEVRQQTNIADVIEPYVQLKKSGQNLFGLCPFHEEKTPSFSVSESKQIFHCFSCGRGGNVYKFLMDMEDLNFPEAVLKVADFSGISLPANYQAPSDHSSEPHAILKQDYQAAQDFYHHILLRTQAGVSALEYLHQRQLTDETIEHFQIGYAPDQSQILWSFFQEKSKSTPELQRSGLFTESDQGQFYDRFQDRVVFPVTDQSGKTIAFSGRLLQPPPPDRPVGKYLNSPETEIFHKSKTLFNLAAAKTAIRKQGEVVLFEGFMDVISAYQAGLKNGVASMGTSLTSEQIYLLQRLTHRLIICYDGDAPGIKAAQRALKLLQETNLEVGVVVLPGGQDPDEFIKKQGGDAFVKLVQHKSLSPVAFMIEFLSQQYDLSNDLQKVDFLNSALKYLAPVQSPVEQELYVRQLAERLQLSVTAVQQELADQIKSQKLLQPLAQEGLTKQAQEAAPNRDLEYSHLDRIEKSERNLLQIVFHFPEVINILDRQNNFHFVHEQYQEIFDVWLRASLTQDQLTVAQFIDLIPENLRNLVTTIEMMPRPASYSEAEVQDYINNLQANSEEQQLRIYQQKIQQAAQIGDSQQELEFTLKLITLRQQIDHAEKKELLDGE